MVAALRGHILEERMHEVLTAREGRPSLKIARLSENRKEEETDLVMPNFSRREFKWENMSDLTTVLENGYCIPLSSKFQSLDAFAIIPRKVFDGNDGLCIAGLQPTTAKSHPLKRA